MAPLSPGDRAKPPALAGTHRLRETGSLIPEAVHYGLKAESVRLFASLLAANAPYAGRGPSQRMGLHGDT